jgi:spore maturation protein A
LLNYIWVALIIGAILFAAYRDIINDPVILEPEPQNIFSAVDSQAISIEIDYDFSNAPDVKYPLDLQIPDKTGTPNGLNMSVKGDAGNHLIAARITDKDGDIFLSPFSERFDQSLEWIEGTFTLEEMIPDPSNPVATPDMPLTLAAIQLIPARTSEVQSGEIQIQSISTTYATVLMVNEEVESQSWMGVISKSSARWATIAIELCIEYIGIMMMWLGLMRIAEKAGMVQALARMLKPVMTRLFPELPPEGEAMGAIIMNMAANMLGLGNAATPLGLKAMEELQKLNKQKEYASDSMCMFLSLNTSSVTIITPAIFGFRVASGSTDIMKFWPVMILSTSLTTIVAITACKLYEKLPMFRIPTKLSKEIENL